MQRHAHRAVVGRGQQHRRHLQLVEVADHRSVLVDADRHRRYVHRRDRVAKDEEPVDLNGYRPRCAEHPRQQFDAMTDSRADDDRLRRRANAAHPGEVFGERLPQFGSAAGISHAQRLGRRVGECAAGGCGPFTTWKLRDVR